MRTLVFFALSLTVLLPGFTQTAANPGTSLQREPREILASAETYYDFSSPELKPWHLKAVFQLYDPKGNATEQGTWEYWWASPKVHRSSWTRTGVEHTKWFTLDGAMYRRDSGNPLRYFERTMEETLLFPLPVLAALDSGRMKLDMKMLPAEKPELECVLTTPQRLINGKLQAPSSGVPSYYCFDPATLALQVIYSNQLTKEYSQLVKTQGRYLARQVVVSEGKQKLFTASVEAIEGLKADDAILNPPADATLEQPTRDPQLDRKGHVIMGTLIKKTYPVYPVVSKMAHVQGVVVLGAVVGTDGRTHDLEVLASPSPSLSESAVDCVKTWEYTPYLVNGAAVEVETIVNVVYSLGN